VEVALSATGTRVIDAPHRLDGVGFTWRSPFATPPLLDNVGGEPEQLTGGDASAAGPDGKPDCLHRQIMPKIVKARLVQIYLYLITDGVGSLRRLTDEKLAWVPPGRAGW